MYYKLSPLPGLMTEGVKELADRKKCWWLVTDIAGFAGDVQRRLKRKGRWADTLFWRLKVTPQQTALLICEYDTDDVVFRHHYNHTDLPPNDVIRIWTEGEGAATILLLPEEH